MAYKYWNSKNYVAIFRVGNAPGNGISLNILNIPWYFDRTRRIVEVAAHIYGVGKVKLQTKWSGRLGQKPTNWVENLKETTKILVVLHTVYSQFHIYRISVVMKMGKNFVPDRKDIHAFDHLYLGVIKHYSQLLFIIRNVILF